MSEPNSSPTSVRFGVFEVDLRAREVRKQGLKIRLQEQPFRILELLLENPGQIVTREEIREKLWSSDTYVDFDRSLNKGINKLRSALADSPDTPRYIETLPRRGYRFIAPVEEIDEIVPAQRSPSRFAWLAVPITLAILGALAVGLNVRGLRDRLPGQRAPGEITSLAVLPFENLSGDSREDYFADGMHEALIAELGKISGLRVISRTSVMQYKGNEKTVPEIARELDVDTVVEGSALREGSRVRITAQLLASTPERHLWSHSYDRDMDSVLLLQGELARAIARQIEVVVLPDEDERLASAPSVQPEAHEAYLKGVFHMQPFTSESTRHAIAYFEEAIRIDPDFALAHAARAHAYFVLGLPLGGVSYQEDMARAQESALRALSLDPRLSAALSARGWLQTWYEWDWKGAETSFLRAIESNPSFVRAHLGYALLLSALGRHREAVQEAKRARELSPLDLSVRTVVAEVLLYARRYQEARRECRLVHDLEVDFARAYLVSSWIADADGRIHEAASADEKRLRLEGVPAEEARGVRAAEQAGGALGYWQWRAERQSGTDRPNHVDNAHVLAHLDHMDDAFRELETAFGEKDASLVMLQVAPWFDAFRADPKFEGLVRRMNFPN